MCAVSKLSLSCLLCSVLLGAVTCLKCFNEWYIVALGFFFKSKVYVCVHAFFLIQKEMEKPLGNHIGKTLNCPNLTYLLSFYFNINIYLLRKYSLYISYMPGT